MDDFTELRHFPQEQEGDCKFNGPLYATCGFAAKFGDDTTALVLAAILQIVRDTISAQGGADYLQVFEFRDIRFWMIDDVDHVTVLLPDEY